MRADRMTLIEIGRRNYLLYLILPHPVKMALLSEASRARLDAINRLFNETAYSGESARTGAHIWCTRRPAPTTPTRSRLTRGRP